MARYVVTVSEDTSDGDLGAGDLSLREAIELSNARSGRDTVVFAGGVREITLADALPTIIDDLVLRGGGAVAIDAAAEDGTAERRVLDINGADAVTVAGLRLTGGIVAAAETDDVGDEGFGGGIRATDVANLHVVNSTISGNAATTGGGIAALGTTALTVTNSEVGENEAHNRNPYDIYNYTRGGGGIYAAGDVSILSSRIHDNSGGTVARGIYEGSGGGISARGDLLLKQSVVVGNHGVTGGGIAASGTITLVGSIVSGNHAIYGGGIAGERVAVSDSVLRNNTARNHGYYHGPTSGGAIAASEVVVANSEISGNVASAYTSRGGGVAADTVTIRNSTIANNFAWGGGADYGGGLSGTTITILSSTLTGNATSGAYYGERSGGGAIAGDTITLRNSLVLGNAVGDAAGDILGTVRSDAVSLIGGDARQVFAATHQIAPGVFAGELAPNGGPTRTVAILRHGLADGAADPTTSPETDQRGIARDGDPDLGSFEFHGRPLILTGGPEADVLSGSDAADRLRGAGGDDAIFGQAGDDRLFGNAGRDSLFGGGGDDRLEGNTGRDRLLGSGGHDTLAGGWGNDSLAGGERGDVLRGQPGEDSLAGGGGSDLLVGGAGRDLLSGETGDDELVGGWGSDRLLGGNGRDRLFGGGGADTLDGRNQSDDQSESDLMKGGRGNDTYLVDDRGDEVVERGAGGFDRVLASVDYALPAGVEALTLVGNHGMLRGTGNPGDNVLRGTEEGGWLSGLRGDDRLHGGADADTLRGGDGADVLDGEGGRDVIVGGEGRDRLAGGAGADVFRFTSATEIGLGRRSDTILDFEAQDTIDLRAIDADTTLSGHQVFSFIGDAAFSGTPGELRFAAGLLAGDVDGDGIADFALIVRGDDPGLLL